MSFHNASTITSRTYHFMGFQFFLLIVILLRLFFLQILYWDHYKRLAEGNRTRTHIQFPKRAEIVDRWGNLIVTNIPSYDAYILPHLTKNPLDLIKQLSKPLKISDQRQKELSISLKKNSKFLPLLLKQNLTWPELAFLELQSVKTPALYTQEGRGRNYILKNQASQLIGYISPPSKNQAKKDKNLLSPGARVGKNGIEYQYEKILSGKIGKKVIEVNAFGKATKELSAQPPTPAQPLQLTIDADLQKFAGELLAPYRSACSIVMDAHTGEILSLVSTPGYDPSLFLHGVRHKQWVDLVNNPLSPMSNKAISGLYSPGSVFKLIIALAALKAGINPSEKIKCPGHMMLGNHKFHCWKWRKSGHGYVDMFQALSESCDVYFYEVALKIKEKEIIAMARNFGIEEKTGIDLPGEKPGFIADPVWKRKTKNEPWYPGDTVLTSIGQGYVLMSPLQLVSMMASLVNGGYWIQPHLIKKENTPTHRKLNLPESHLKIILESLNHTVNMPSGTAYASRIQEETYRMIGKTSTSQVRHITQAERQKGLRSHAQLPWHLRDTSIFVGAAPDHHPRYCVVVIGEHEGWGSGFAAQKAKKILHQTQKIMGGKKYNE